MWTNFSDDWSKTATCIALNMNIEVTSRYDVMGDVIIMELILVEFLVSNWGYIENCIIFKTDENLKSGANFFVISVTGS